MSDSSGTSPTYVISLDRSPERRNLISNHCKAIVAAVVAAGISSEGAGIEGLE